MTSRRTLVLCLFLDLTLPVGGIARFNRELVTALERSGFDPDCLVLREPPGQGRECRRERYRGGLIGYVVHAVRVAFARRHECHSIVCGHITLMPAAVLLSWITRRKLYLVVHGIEAWRPTRRFLINRLISQTDRIISVSYLTLDRFCAWSGIPVHCGHVVGNVVPDTLEPAGPVAESRLAAAYNELTATRVFGCFGVLRRDKGVDVLLDALSTEPELRDMGALIAGDGPDKSRLEAKARRCGLTERVAFVGRITDDEKPTFFGLIDGLVMVGTKEGFGIVYLEALSYSTAAVGSWLDGSREALMWGHSGELADPRDTATVARAISRAVGSDPLAVAETLDVFSRASFQKRIARALRA